MGFQLQSNYILGEPSKLKSAETWEMLTSGDVYLQYLYKIDKSSLNATV